MKKYIAILGQEGEGCDHTIGCGLATYQFEAEIAVAVGNKLREIVRDNYNHDDTKLKSLIYFEVASTFEVDLNLWYSKFEEEEKAMRKQIETREELAELERLKKKYNQ